LIDSSKIKTLKKSVDKGPIIPTCEAIDAPILSIANMTNKTGVAVHATALIIDNSITSIGTLAALKGSTSKNCKIQHMQAILDAHPTNRSEPILCTNSPLKIKYKEYVKALANTQNEPNATAVPDKLTSCQNTKQIPA